MTRTLTPRTRAALRARDRAERQLAHARAELHAAIAAELADGYPPTALAAATGYTTARVRQLARAAGIPPARKTARPVDPPHARRARAADRTTPSRDADAIF